MFWTANVWGESQERGGEETTLSNQWQLTYSKTLCVGTHALQVTGLFSITLYMSSFAY